MRPRNRPLSEAVLHSEWLHDGEYIREYPQSPIREEGGADRGVACEEGRDEFDEVGLGRTANERVARRSTRRARHPPPGPHAQGSHPPAATATKRAGVGRKMKLRCRWRTSTRPPPGSAARVSAASAMKGWHDTDRKHAELGAALFR